MDRSVEEKFRNTVLDAYRAPSSKRELRAFVTEYRSVLSDKETAAMTALAAFLETRNPLIANMQTGQRKLEEVAILNKMILAVIEKEELQS